MCARTEVHQYGGSDVDEAETRTEVAEDAEAVWWSKASPAKSAEDRTDADWWKGAEGLIEADRLEPLNTGMVSCWVKRSLELTTRGFGLTAMYSSSGPDVRVCQVAVRLQ